MSFADELLKSLGRILKDVLRTQTTTRRKPIQPPSINRKTYPGDFSGRLTIAYDPHPGTIADPGEVIWTWVPFEEDHRQGKDRPVVVIGRDGDWLLGLSMSSQDHDIDKTQEARDGRYWVNIGSGNWDASRRPSEVRVNRIIRINPHEVRRVVGKLDKAKFDKVAAAVRQYR